MPPKRSKAVKHDNRKSVHQDESKTAMLSMFQQLDHEKVKELTGNLEGAVRERAELQRQFDDGEKKTHEFVNHFQHELEKKDALVVKQREELIVAEQTLESATQAIKDKFERQLTALKEERDKTEAGLLNRLRVVEVELQKLDSFRESKLVMETRINELETQLGEQETKHRFEQADQERRFLMDKQKTVREYEKGVSELEEGMRVQLTEGRDAESRKIIAENRRIKDELRFQTEVTDELNAEKRATNQANALLGRELSLFEGKEQEYARQGKSKTKEIHGLRDRVVELDRALGAFQKASKAGGSEASGRRLQAQADEAVLDAKGLRQVLQLKNRELHALRVHATTVLEQRTEVEQFFLEALEQCKGEIAEQRTTQYRESLAQYRGAMSGATTGQAGAGVGGGSISSSSSSGCGGGGGGGNEDEGSHGSSPQSSRRNGGSRRVGAQQASHPSASRLLSSSSRVTSAGDRGGTLRVAAKGVSGAASFDSGGSGGDRRAAGEVILEEGVKRLAFPKIRPANTQRGLLGGKLPGGLPEGREAVLGLDGLPMDRHESALPLGPPPSKVQLSDLGWADREKVLRMLFAKINGLQAPVKRLPDHPLQQHGPQGQEQKQQPRGGVLDAN